MSKKVNYVIQDSWDGGPWKDHWLHHSNRRDAEVYFKERLTNPIWDGEGKRKWRLIERTIEDKVLK